MALDRIGGTVGPVVDQDDAGLLSLRWPDGQRRPELTITADLLDGLLDQVNTGTRALAVLGEVARALGRLAG